MTLVAENGLAVVPLHVEVPVIPRASIVTEVGSVSVAIAAAILAQASPAKTDASIKASLVVVPQVRRV